MSYDIAFLDFWTTYHQLVKDEFRIFKMRKLRDFIPHDGDRPMLFYINLPNVTFNKKWKKGNVDTNFKKEFSI